ncbi:MAG: RNA polymerase sporulation sigma factor SigK [Christensenellales bacterium]|jgi:RNA polymerase sporulation-specific sigma factor
MDAFLAWIKELIFFIGYVSREGSFPKPLSSEAEKDALERYAKGDHQARQTLIEHNLRLVAHIAKKYSGGGRDMDDLISSGTIGLIKAISSYNNTRGTQLATYAARCIENEILMNLRAQKKFRNDISLQEPIGNDQEGNEISLMDILGSDPDSVMDIVHKRIRSDQLHACVVTLDARQRVVLEMRYGLAGNPPMTQREVGRTLGISRSYVSRIEKKAIENLILLLREPRHKKP